MRRDVHLVRAHPVQADPEGADDMRLADELTDLILRYLMVEPPS